MITDEKTRIEFARRQDWNIVPDVIDHNLIHIALMGMSDNEWIIFQIMLCEDRPIMPKRFVSTPLSTLVACYLGATKGRKK